MASVLAGVGQLSQLAKLSYKQKSLLHTSCSARMSR